MQKLVTFVLVISAATLVSAEPTPKNLTKTRPGSFLKKDKLWEDPVDMRGDFERRRDQELVTHYRRLAELDVIADLAKKADDDGLLEDVEDVRRKETQRHQLAMMRFRRDPAGALSGGGK